MPCPRFLIPAIVAAALVAPAQEIPTSHEIVQYSPEQADALIREVIDQEFSPVLVDRLAVLLINRPAEVVPKLAGYIRAQYGLPEPEREERTVRTASSLVAYAGDETALRAVEELIALDRDRFTPLVQSTLNNAQSWRNPYDVAYRAIEIGNAAVRAEVERWVQSRTDSWVSQRYWAAAMVERYPSGLTDSVLESDPLVVMLEPKARDVTTNRLREESVRVREQKRQ